MSGKKSDKHDTSHDHDGDLPAQMRTDPPKTPDPDDAGEGAKNSANPVQDDATPTNTNTQGF